MAGFILAIECLKKHRRFLPAGGPERIRTIEWLMHVMTDVNPTVSAVYYTRLKVERPDEATAAMFEARLFTHFHTCCFPLEAGDYLAGDLSLADIALYPLVDSRRDAIRANPQLAPLSAWAARMAARPAVIRGMSAIT